jgi:hypothetical protein
LNVSKLCRYISFKMKLFTIVLQQVVSNIVDNLLFLFQNKLNFALAFLHKFILLFNSSVISNSFFHFYTIIINYFLYTKHMQRDKKLANFATYEQVVDNPLNTSKN